MSYEEKFIRLYNDTTFQKIRSYYSQSTIFDILGIARLENIHSRFLAWILNPTEFHQMGDEPLRKLIRLLYYSSKKESLDEQKFPSVLALPVLTNSYSITRAEVRCEKSITEKKRIDIYINANIFIGSKEKNLHIIIENKIDSAEHDNQTRAYYEWAMKKKTGKDIILAMYLTPFEKNSCSDEHYIHITYQQLTDFILAPLTDLPKTKIAEVLIEEYIRNLGRQPFVDGKANNNRTIMAIPQKEKELIKEFYNNNQDLMSAIINVLAEDSEVQLDDSQRKALLSINSSTLQNRDTNAYRYRDVMYTAHTELVKQVIKDFAQENRMSISEFIEKWRFKKGQYMNKDDYEKKFEANELKWPFDRTITNNDWIDFTDNSIIISSNWPLRVKSTDAEFALFLKKAAELKIEIEVIPRKN